MYKSSYKKLDDRQLWNSFRNSDKQCLSTLFNRYYSKLFNYGFNIVQNDEFVKDCIQELFLTLLEQRNTVSNAYSVHSYLFVSMRRMLFYNLRKRKNQQIRNKVFTEHFIDENFHIENRIINSEIEHELADILQRALSDLSNRQKQVIHLKYFEGLSNSEIAKLLCINRQSVYNHVSEAIKQLKYSVKSAA